MNQLEHATRSRCLVWVLTLTCSLLPAGLFAADPNPLLNLVSSDAALVVEVNNLRQETERLRSSEIFKRIRNHPAFRSWSMTKEFQSTLEKWSAAEKKFGRPPHDVILDIIGARIVLAAYLSEANGEDQSAGVFLTEIESQETLNTVLAAFVDSEKLTVESQKHAGGEYSTAARKDKSQVFWCRLPTVFAVSESESAIKRVLERHAASGLPQDSFRSTPAYQLARSAAGASPICVVLSPQRWNKTLNIDGMLTNDDEVERLIGAAWKRLRSVSWSTSFDDGVRASLHVHFERIPPATLAGVGLLRWLDPTNSAERVPADSLAAAGLTLDASSALSTLIHIDKSTAPSEGESLSEFMGLMKGWFAGRELQEVLKGQGTDISVCIVPAAEASPLLVDLLVEWPYVKQNSETAPIKASQHRETLDYAVNYSLTLLSFGLNVESKGRFSTHVQTQKTADASVRWIEGWPIAQPAGVAASDRLILSTSPAAIRDRLATTAPPRSLASNHRFRRVVTEPHQHFVYWNVAGTVRFLRDNSQAIAKYVAQVRGKAPAEMPEKILRIADLLDVVDAAAVSVKLSDDHLQVDFAVEVDSSQTETP